ncbi:hypothetical protein DFH09DRAFT_1352362 [Mycena vulgaris]|nr:hypothetical protein DFH09DRAFT_1352362 [Mycena vulgaris]
MRLLPPRHVEALLIARSAPGSHAQRAVRRVDLARPLDFRGAEIPVVAHCWPRLHSAASPRLPQLHLTPAPLRVTLRPEAGACKAAHRVDLASPALPLRTNIGHGRRDIVCTA